MTTTPTTLSDPTVPPEATLLVPAPPETVPSRNPEGTWALVITTVRLALADHDYPTDPARTDTAEVFAGVWLPAPPPAHAHRGDVAVRLAPASKPAPNLDLAALGRVLELPHQTPTGCPCRDPDPTLDTSPGARSTRTPDRAQHAPPQGKEAST
ncbi:hypothetical protein [Amycolatopsis sp. CA-230715]|uniref:hypothetical protein n=1 Tax=Amycolatopsis sp. CA-230715 TaxID=2745196 RepID=UPI001C015FF7|nr:hypothetical protein [Amycolatopsis sp. CA-230715]QWF81028.1 hypothetical protein HUW46_04453 [Amycolatopsis sp. CA-230715]